MCRRFAMLTLDEVEGIVHAIQFDTPFNVLPDWPARPADAYPKSEAPLIISGASGLQAKLMRWGYPLSWNKNVAFNTRIETALKSPDNMWRDSLEHRRCIVPSLGFFEPHLHESYPSPKTGNPIKQQYRFTMTDSPILFMAGIYDKEGHFSLVTTEPIACVSPIHDRMPLALPYGKLGLWLDGDIKGALKSKVPLLQVSKA